MGATQIWRNPIIWFDSHQPLICYFLIISLEKAIKLAKCFCCPWQRSCTLEMHHSGPCCLYGLSPCGTKASWGENKGRPVAYPEGPQPCQSFMAVSLKEQQRVTHRQFWEDSCKEILRSMTLVKQAKICFMSYFSSTLAAFFSWKRYWGNLCTLLPSRQKICCSFCLLIPSGLCQKKTWNLLLCKFFTEKALDWCWNMTTWLPRLSILIYQFCALGSFL